MNVLSWIGVFAIMLGVAYVANAYFGWLPYAIKVVRK